MAARSRFAIASMTRGDVPQQPPIIVAPVQAQEQVASAEGAGPFSPPSNEALDRLYRPKALDVPVLVARDAPIVSVDPRSVSNFPPPDRPDTAAQGTVVAEAADGAEAIERLAEAAEAFGRGEMQQRFKPHGAREVRAAARAFMDMRDRIQRHIDQRTALLASVSHDLRTPLTRLRLELALAPPFKRASAMQGDLDQMEHMIDEYLAFAQGEAGEASETLPVNELLNQAAEDARRIGAAVEVEVPDDLMITVRPLAFRRALANLVGNAAAHGDKVRLSARRLASGGTEIAVEDDGPGIPEDMHEEAFRPFSRLDASRNQNRKGVGLGLAIARDVARSHGGDITLDRSDLGGLMARIRLPG